MLNTRFSGPNQLGKDAGAIFLAKPNIKSGQDIPQRTARTVGVLGVVR